MVCYPLPDGRMHALQFPWLRQFPPENIIAVSKIQTMIVCTRNQTLLDCAKRTIQYDEFVFIDGDVMPNSRTEAFWDSDADVVCCKAEMPTNHGAWTTENAWHDPLWRCKSIVLERVPLPYYSYTLNNLGTKETCCICQGFARKCRAAGFTTDVSGECGHQMCQTWATSGCKDKDFGE